MSRAIVAILALIILSTFGVYGFEAALENAGEDELVVNETWTPDAGNVTTLDDSNLNGAYYGDDVSVYDENGTLQDAGTDYRWFVGNGTVKALAGGGLASDTSAKITYAYQETSADQRQMAALAGELPRLLGLVFPALVVVIFLLFIMR